MGKDGATAEVHTTETIPNNLNPVWKPVSTGVSIDDFPAWKGAKGDVLAEKV